VTFIHRYQVAKYSYVIFDKYFSIQGKFHKNLKIQIFLNAVVKKIVFVFRAKDDCFIGAFE
jgi:type IV secretory pathway VirB6-like protein